jgi:hypothetical protein
MNLFATSRNLWELNRPLYDVLVNDLQTNITVSVQISYTIKHNLLNQDDLEEVVTGENRIDIEIKDEQIRNSLIRILNRTFDSQETR